MQVNDPRQSSHSNYARITCHSHTYNLITSHHLADLTNDQWMIDQPIMKFQVAWSRPVYIPLLLRSKGFLSLSLSSHPLLWISSSITLTSFLLICSPFSNKFYHLYVVTFDPLNKLSYLSPLYFLFKKKYLSKVILFWLKIYQRSLLPIWGNKMKVEGTFQSTISTYMMNSFTKIFIDF